MTAGGVRLALSPSPIVSTDSSSVRAPCLTEATSLPFASATPQVPSGNAMHRRKTAAAAIGQVASMDTMAQLRGFTSSNSSHDFATASAQDTADLLLADTSFQVPAVNAAPAVPEAGVPDATTSLQVGAAAAATAFLVPEAVVLDAVPGIQAPAVDAAAAAASPPAPEAFVAPDASGMQVPLVNVAAPAAAEAVVQDVQPGLHLPLPNAAAVAAQAGLQAPNAAALAQVADLGPSHTMLVNPTGTGRVPFVIRRPAPGVCGVKLSEQHQQTGTRQAPGCHAFPSLQKLARAVHISSLIDTPKPGDLLSDLHSQMN